MIHSMNAILNASWRKTRKTFLPAAICAAVLSACGGGADSTGSSIVAAATDSNSPAAILAPTLKSVSASVVATGADCSLFNANNHVLASAKSSSKKVVDFGKVNASGNVMVSCAGGTYEDLSTGVQLKGGVHHGVAKLSDTGGTTVAVNPLTELAYRQAGGDVAQVAGLAKAVAASFEIGPDADLQNVAPIDLLTTEAKKDDVASQYGVALAALSQARKDLGRSEDEILTIIQQTWTANGIGGDGQAMVSDAKWHLLDTAYNLNPVVRANVLGSAKDVDVKAWWVGSDNIGNDNLDGKVKPNRVNDYATAKATAWQWGARYGSTTIKINNAGKGTAWQTPWAGAIVAVPYTTGYANRYSVAGVSPNGQGASNAVGISPLVPGRTYLIGVLGHKLHTTLINFSGMTCTNTWLWPNDEIWTECTPQANATQARMWLTTTNGERVTKYAGSGDPTTVWPVAPVNTCPVPTVTSMTPTSAYYSSTTTFTLNGCGFTNATTATLEGVSCTPIAGGTATQRQYTCPVTGDRTKPSGPLVAGGNTTGTQTVTYLGAPVVITAVSPSPLIVGGTGGNPSTVTGTGFYPGMPVRLNGVACRTNGTVNAAGTQITGADCSNVGPIPDVASVPMTAGTGNFTGTFPVRVVAPAPATLGVVAPTPIKVGTTGHTAVPSSNSSGAITFTSSNPAIATVNPTTGAITPVAPGSITITASQAAVPGKFGSAAATAPVTVTAADLVADPNMAYQQPGPVAATLGINPTVTNPVATLTCTGVTSYAPPVTYSIAPAGATITQSGVVSPTAAGTYTITASVPAVAGTPGCNPKSITYTLNVAKAPATFGFTSTAPVTTTVGAVTNNPAKVTGVTGFATPTGLITYSSSNPAVATVDANTGAVTAKTAGTVTIDANYAGDNNYLSAVANPPYTVSVGSAPTTTYTYVNYDGTTQSFATDEPSTSGQGWCAVIQDGPSGKLIWENPSVNFEALNAFTNTYTNSSNGAASDVSGLITAMNGLNAGRGYCGYNDWRLPTLAELQTTVKPPSANSLGAWVDIKLFRNPAQLTFWTSTFAGTGKATINYATGQASSAALPTPLYVHLVRNAQ